MKNIGGYFELELHSGEQYHKDALCLNSARSCLEYVLRVRNYHTVYIPYYTCEIVLQPFQLLHVNYVFYNINEQLEPVNLPELKEDEAFLYTNYFGLKQSCVERLSKHYGTRLIVDNAQAFFAPALYGIDTFYSPRKFFGVPDGGYLYCSVSLNMEIPQAVSHDRMSHLLKRIDLDAQAGYDNFKQNDELLSEQPLLRMSNLTGKLLESIDYQPITTKRHDNYQLLDNSLGSCNQLRLDLSEHAVPMVYPFLTDNADLKKKLIENKIFVATYWPNVMEWCKEDDWEFHLAHQTCFLPIDQRYGKDDMGRIIDIVLGK